MDLVDMAPRIPYGHTRPPATGSLPLHGRSLWAPGAHPAPMVDRRTATLPLHSGSTPRWLFDRMTTLGGAIAETIIEEHGHEAFLRRLADPYWFQAFGCVLGFDWHSSGLTTTTMGALKEALDPVEHGILIAGGKGAVSRKTPDEITASKRDLGLGRQAADMVRASRLSAKVDNACIHDSYALYHHTFIVSERGDWCVVQQGMNDDYARRYHWHADAVDTFVEEPHTAICAMQRHEAVLDLTASTSVETRQISLDLVNDDPTRLKRHIQSPEQQTLDAFSGSEPELTLPAHHDLRLSDLSERSIDRLKRAYEVQPTDFEELIGLDGIGPASIRALALIAELVYGSESSWRDPAAYAFAHGGKDGTPHPVDRERYDRSIEYIRGALEGAEIDRRRKRSALQRLYRFTGSDQ